MSENMSESEFMVFYNKAFNEMMAMANKLANKYGYVGMPYYNNWKAEISIQNDWNKMNGK